MTGLRLCFWGISQRENNYPQLAYETVRVETRSEKIRTVETIFHCT